MVGLPLTGKDEEAAAMPRTVKKKFCLLFSITA
jgi:hypothetical protein